MKEFISFAIVMVLCAAAIYGVGSFVAFDLNPANWGAAIRFISGSLMGYLTLKALASLDGI